MDHAHAHDTDRSGLNGIALSATLHCLTGCAIGEVLGMVIGTALGFSEWGTIALAVGLAFFFGYLLTSLPLLRAGMALSVVAPIAFASDTLSITVMEVVDNGIMLAVPGAMESGVGDVLFWGALAFALVVAGAVALPVNRWLIARGKGHAVVHETGIHGGPSPRVVGAIAVAAFVFGTTVLLTELGGGTGHAAAARAQGNGVDRAFVAAMVPHHASAIAMGRLGEQRAESPFLRQVAASIVRTQREEVATMRRLDRRLAAAGIRRGHLGVRDRGAVRDTAAGLRSARPFDPAFVAAMIPHHEDAIAMAEAQLERGANPDLKRLAQQIIDAQRREIDALAGQRR